MKKLLIYSFLLLVGHLSAQSILSPNDFLKHNIGEQFTPHHQLVDYYEHVAENSPNVMLKYYGDTYEGRPLILAFVSTPENLAKLEDIRLNQLRRTGLEEGAVDESMNLAITWVSFSVHGNEAAGSEASMPVLYELVATGNDRTKKWLENSIVILDPSINPDGYSRYTHWYRRYANRIPNTDLASLEHNEPWPNGRVNHYLFDLNRDSTCVTQAQSLF
ncbi:MAG: M14 family zinc carboxypeptidase, partial [Bacteroidota bacterium]